MSCFLHFNSDQISSGRLTIILFVCFFQLNQAAKEVMNGDVSPSSSSSSDEESESTRRKRGKRTSRQKSVSTSAATEEVNASPPWVRHDQLSATNDPVTKRHTIHVENPNEQQRQSRRALDLNDDFEPQERSRAMSQGRRSSESPVVVSLFLLFYQNFFFCFRCLSMLNTFAHINHLCSF